MTKKIKPKTEEEKSGNGDSFESSMQKLEGLVRELEGGNLGLSESLDKYEQGVRYLKQCYQLLEQAEKKVQLLTGVDAEGNPVVEDFDHEATTFERNATVEQNDRSGKTSGRAPGRKVRKREASSRGSAETEDTDDIDDPGRLF